MIKETSTSYRSTAISFIVDAETYRDKAYYDTAIPKKATIGYGFNLEVNNYLLLVLVVGRLKRSGADKNKNILQPTGKTFAFSVSLR